MSPFLIVLAAFGVSYILLDSTLLENVRRKFWPEAGCYFCVGFWAAIALWVGNYVSVEFFGPPLDRISEMFIIGLASCGVSGWLANHLVVYERDQNDPD